MQEKQQQQGFGFGFCKLVIFGGSSNQVLAQASTSQYALAEETKNQLRKRSDKTWREDATETEIAQKTDMDRSTDLEQPRKIKQGHKEGEKEEKLREGSKTLGLAILTNARIR